MGDVDSMKRAQAAAKSHKIVFFLFPACAALALSKVLRAITRKFGFEEDAERGVDLEEIVRDRIPPQVCCWMLSHLVLGVLVQFGG